MDVDSFFEALEQQYASKLPFVVYSRPINSVIKCWLQKDDKIHYSQNFTEHGFVFSPFNLEDKSVLLPQEKCAHYTLEIDELKVNRLQQEFSVDLSDQQLHIDLVNKGLKAIKTTNLSKVVLSRNVKKSADISQPLETFKHLFNSYKNAMVYCWYHPKIGLWLGATPELLFKIEGQKLTTISLAGTQPVTDNDNVIWTNKEIEEQQIVTDYIRHQIEPYSKTINVSKAETVRAGNLWHLKSRIISVISKTTRLKSIIEALHPTPAVCGFPKQNAKDFILENENYKREFYTGFLGEINLKQATTRNTNRRNVENNAYAVVKTQSNFYVNLRCTQLKYDKAIIYVGGGITKDSIAENEWEETVNKTKTIGSILN